ncbi:MAG: hypothetical protein ACLP5H_23375 [Desulfomonilaceae bacterium]
MKRSENIRRGLDKAKSDKPVENSSCSVEDDPVLVAYIRAKAASSEEFYWMMKFLSSDLPRSNIENILARKMDEMRKALNEMRKALEEMQAVHMRLEWIELEHFSVPEWTINVIRSGIWKYRAERLLGEIVQFGTFREFVETPPPMGMGSSLEKLRNICSGSEEALRMIDEVAGE